MAAVVGVHGIGQQVLADAVLVDDWAPCLVGGVRLAGGHLRREDVGMAFYGDLFRPPGRSLAVGDVRYTAADVEDGLEEELLLAWWREAARVDSTVLGPDSRTLLRTPGLVQTGLRMLSRLPYFADVALRAMIADLKQVRRYLLEAGIRERVWERIDSAVGPDTRVLVGHSLGSVAAYEWLWHRSDSPVTTLVTMGSPLGIRDMVFTRLRPPPDLADGTWPGTGRWPGTVRAWTNVADGGDIVALEKDLQPLFGRRVACHLVHNGSHAHDARPYLTSPEVGRAVTAGLADIG
ncbi:hypothetical protein [Streptomyces sp. NPDC029041]|uniref:hypothetical protein n=1 Tax=Streptomyces sp. NPDC029041 TaxID=3155727 RepID=UPI0034059D71